MEPETMNAWSWIIPLLAGITGAVLGYLFGKSQNTAPGALAELEELKDQYSKLQLELSAALEKPAAGKSPLIHPAIPFNPRAARAAFGKRIQEDDLKLIEGIGIKIESLFHNFDIKTWLALSETSVAKCQEVLDSGGDRYNVHDPSSWPMQARMAYEGKWKDLAKWQEEHKHGKL